MVLPHMHERHATRPAEPERYEVCELVRSRGGAQTLRVIATADSEDGARATARMIADRRADEASPFQIYDTAARLWLTRV